VLKSNCASCFVFAHILCSVRDTGEAAKPRGALRDLLVLLFSRTTLVWLGIALILVLIPAHLIWLLEQHYKDAIISSTNYFPGILEAMY
jgi:polar amino acid transport system substrate-binding protein